MENKFDTNEIEESLRICEELLQNNPDFNRRAPRPVEALELAKNVNSSKPAQSKPEVPQNRHLRLLLQQNPRQNLLLNRSRKRSLRKNRNRQANQNRKQGKNRKPQRRLSL